MSSSCAEVVGKRRKYAVPNVMSNGDRMSRDFIQLCGMRAKHMGKATPWATIRPNLTHWYEQDCICLVFLNKKIAWHSFYLLFLPWAGENVGQAFSRDVIPMKHRDQQQHPEISTMHGNPLTISMSIEFHLYAPYLLLILSFLFSWYRQ